jgi:xanthine dehydrogenase YagT iron-sulfur-binding subunit
MPRTIHKGGTWGPILIDGVAQDAAPSYAAAAFRPWPDAAALANHLLHVHALIDAPRLCFTEEQAPMADPHRPNHAPLSRRTFMMSTAASAAMPLASGATSAVQAQALAPALPEALAAIGAGTQATMPMALRVNGSEHRLNLDPRTALLDALREHVGLMGSKKGCDHGQCGACTVLLDGERVLSCLTLAAQAQGRAVTTIEGLSAAGGLHPMQQAFIDNDAFQCGYCTPGQIMSAVACVHEGRAGSDDEIREYMSGNLCRCAAYPNIVAAVRQAAPQMRRA